jgi:hypothetical protein
VLHCGVIELDPAKPGRFRDVAFEAVDMRQALAFLPVAVGAIAGGWSAD